MGSSLADYDLNLINLDGDPRNYLKWRLGGENTVELFDIHVGTERRKGIGTRLVEQLLKEVPKTTTLIFAVTKFRATAAHQFYEAVGFRCSGRLHTFYVEGSRRDHALVYALDVAFCPVKNQLERVDR